MHESKESEQSKELEEAKTILPGDTIGILGGGQLGRMMAIAGRNMGYRFVTLDPTPNSPCGQAADRQITANYDDQQAAKQLAELSDVITYEFENVDAETARMLTEKSHVPQGSQLLYITQHRLREKQAIEAAGATVAPYKEIRTSEQLRTAIRELGMPSVLKTTTGGYDGKGQYVIRTSEQLQEAIDAVEKDANANAERARRQPDAEHQTDMEHPSNMKHQPDTERKLDSTAQRDKASDRHARWVLEQFVDFFREISVIAARNPQGQTRTFPVAENIHVDNILHISIAPARIPEEMARKAQQLAEAIADSLGVVGLLAVEMFAAKNGELYINELAPRPHNSGHYTMEACQTSQFEQHIRAICNLPLGPTQLMTPVVMVNLLGEHIEPLMKLIKSGELYKLSGAVTPKLHLYGKSEVKPKRKMGHLNLLANDVEDALAWIEQAGIWRSFQ